LQFKKRGKGCILCKSLFIQQSRTEGEVVKITDDTDLSQQEKYR
jgi:hypothetical protein